MSYEPSGHLTTDQRQVDDSETWDSDADWNAAQTMNNVVVENGTVKLAETVSIPDTVEYQVRVEEFANPWPFNVGGIDMTINGLTASTFSNGEDSVAGDGIDDRGSASGPESLASEETFGIALSIEYVAANGFQVFTGADDGPEPRIHIREDGLGTSGNIGVSMRDNSDNELRVYSDDDYSGSPRAIIINKTGNSASNVDIYVDDMATPVAVTQHTDGAFDHSNTSISTDMGFYARHSSGSFDLNAECDAGIFEFGTEPYTESERDGFVSRRSEV